jgi:hypothetical protein
MKLIFKQPKKKISKLLFFNPIKLNTKSSVRKIPLKNLTWSQASLRFSRMNPFGDADRDGKLNMFDCKPFDKKRHSKLLRDEISRRVFFKNKEVSNPYKKLSKMQKDNEVKLKDEYFEKTKQIYKKVYPNLNIDMNTPKIRKKFEDIVKITGEKDIVKHLEKRPQLIKDVEKLNIEKLNINESFKNNTQMGIQGRTWVEDTNRIALSPYLMKKHDFGSVIEHELSHIEQSKDKQEFNEKRKSKYKDIEEYDSLPSEEDAERRRILKRKEWESYKEEKPETLQSLDLEDIKPIEIKEED